MVILILFFILIMGLGIFMASAVVFAWSNAKKDARIILENGITDMSKFKKTLKILASCKDNEGQRLYTKLADLEN